MNSFLQCLPALASAQCIFINQKYCWTCIHANHRLYWPVLFLKICLSASNLNVLFAQESSADICPWMTQLSLNSLLIFTQVQCSSVVWVQPIDLALNNGIILTGWGWTAIVNNILSSATLLSSWKHFGSPHLSPLMSDWQRWTIKIQIIKEGYVALVS